MKLLLVAFIISLSCLHFSCRKDGFTNSPDARLLARADTLRFDTVFTTVGSITKSFTLVNDNAQKLKINSIKLAGGASSFFNINVDGIAGTSFSNLELNAGDSTYVFVKVTIDPSAANAPFVILDSIEIAYNGNESKVYLQAYGQNARFVKNQIISTNTTWDNELPYVIQNNFLVAAGATLTIEKGTRIYTNATAAFIVNGTLKVLGEKEDSNRVIFRGDRLDEAYRGLPGGWPGIVFTSLSQRNEMKYASVLNAYQAVVVVGNANQVPAKLLMNECIIQNAYDVGLYGFNTAITASNCLISQCGNDGQLGFGGSNVILTAGGEYNFNHCTIATFSNLYQNHKQPSCFISNSDGASVAALGVNFTNCIIYGLGGMAEDELIVQKSGADQVLFSNVIYKLRNNEPAGVIFTDCIKNADPLFDSINTSMQEYNFRLKEISPAIDAGKTSAATIDLDGNARPAGLKPDIGSYEKQ